MYSVDLFSKNSLRSGIVKGEPNIFKDNDLIAGYVVIDFDPSSQGKLHIDLGKDILSKGIDAIEVSVSTLGVSPPISAFFGTVGAILTATGGVMMTVGVIEVFQESNISPLRNKDSQFYLMDPEKLSFKDSDSGRNSKGAYHLMDTQKVDKFFKEMNDRLEKAFNSAKETRESLHDGRDDLGTLADRGIGEKRESHLSGKLS